MSLELKKQKKYEEDWHEGIEANFQKIVDYANDSQKTTNEIVSQIKSLTKSDDDAAEIIKAIMSQLDNKVSKIAPGYTDGHIKDLLSTINDDKVVVGPNVTGMPLDNCYWVGSITGDATTKRLDVMSTYYPYSRYYTHLTKPGGISGWKQLATAEPPTKYQIPYVTGFSDYQRSYFYKNQFNEVVINVSFLPTSGTFEFGTLIFVLPEGFRPDGTMELSATVCTDGAGNRFTTNSLIEPDGRVSFCYLEPANKGFLSCKFLATE